jgi:hypothetical protein
VSAPVECSDLSARGRGAHMTCVISNTRIGTKQTSGPRRGPELQAKGRVSPGHSRCVGSDSSEPRSSGRRLFLQEVGKDPSQGLRLLERRVLESASVLIE